MFKRWVAIVAFLFSTQLFATSALAYQAGDILSPQAQRQLAMNPQELTIVDFFAEWCVSCREELPEVNTLAQQLAGRGVTVVGVDVDEDVAMGKAFQKKLGLTFRVVNDAQQVLVNDFQPIGMPALYYIYQGKVLKVRYGAINHIRQVIMDDLSALGLTK